MAEAKKLLAEGFEKRKADELKKLLAHADRRVRQEAQFALAARGKEGVGPLTAVASEGKSVLARLHAIWGLGQIARSESAALDGLRRLLDDRDAEVRAQAANVAGEIRLADAFDPLVSALGDESLRVRYFAAQGLGSLKRNEAVIPLLDMLAENADRDPVLRHGGVMGLAGAATDAAPHAQCRCDTSRVAA